jgi:SNF2 family DNA or RNA helicase
MLFASQVIRDYEFYFPKDIDYTPRHVLQGNRPTRAKQGVPFKFHVIITSYEMVLADTVAFQSIPWQVVVVDEAHRLRSNKSKVCALAAGAPNGVRSI